MQRFYSPPETIKDNKILIQDQQTINHIKNVLRLKVDDQIYVFDGLGNEYTGNIETIEKNKIAVRIKTRQEKEIRDKVYIAVACAIPKKAKFDDIIEKLTQLGVDEIIPLNTEHTIVKKSQTLRWMKIAINAVEQSQRDILPKINDLTNFKGTLSKVKEFDLAIIPTLHGGRKPLNQVLSGIKANKIMVLIGPEGDFSSEEVDLAKDYGCIPVSLGDLVFKVDTAAIYIASILRYINL